MKKIMFLTLLLPFCAWIPSGMSLEKDVKIGVVNFSNCISESKAGKDEQAQMEKIKNDWSQRIQEKQKKLNDLEEKSKNQDYMDGLSPDAAKAHEAEKENLINSLNEDQNHLYQTLNQANYFLLHKLYRLVTKASETVVSQKGLDFVLNSESGFYFADKLYVTKDVIKEMDKNYDQEKAKEKVTPKEAVKEKVKDATKQK